MSPKPPLRLDVLLAHEPLVRSVARAILRGDPSVDDVVQDTWMAALEGGPREPRAAGSWLRSVARNRALNVLRERGRRQRREQTAARSECAPDVAAIVEREAVRRWLVEAMLELAEPYRTCLLLRFYEDLPPREIAERLGVPVETAKTRIRRGLNRMRSRLESDPERPGGTFRGAVVGLAGLGRMGDLKAASVAGGVVMGTKSISVSVAALLLVALGVWALFGKGAAPSLPPSDPEPTPVESAAITPDTNGPTLAAHKAPPTSVRRSAFPSGAARGIVVDSKDVPVAEVCVRIVPASSAGKRRSTQSEPDPRGAGYATASDSLGRFALASLPPEDRELLLLRDGFEVAVVKPSVFDTGAGEPARIVLRRGRLVEGVVQSTEGTPVPVARIMATAQPGSGAFVSYRAESNAEGQFRFRYLPKTKLNVSVDAMGYQGVRRVVQDVTSADPLVITLKRTALWVHVVDAETGQPIGNAGAILQTPDGAYRTGLDRARKTFLGSPYPPGWLMLRFFLQEHVFPHAAGTLYVVAPGYMTVRREVTRDVKGQPPAFEVRMLRKLADVALGGNVVGGSRATLEVRTPRPARWAGMGDASLPLLVTMPVATNGSFAVRGLPPGRYRLIVKAEGVATQSLDVTAPTTGLRIELAPGGTIDVEVEPPTATWVHLEQPGGRSHWVQQTDAAGRTQFDGLPPGHYRATIRTSKTPGRLMPRQWTYLPVRVELDLAPGGKAKLTVPVPARRSFALLVVDENGSGREGVRARVTVNPGSYASLTPGGRPRRRPGSRPETGADGRIEFEIYPGVYGVELRSGTQRRTTWFRVKRRGSATQTMVLARETRRIAGRVLDADTSAPIAGRRVEVTVADSKSYEMLGHGHTDDRGHFVIEGVPAQTVLVQVATNLDAGRAVIQDNPYPNAKVRIDVSKSPPSDLTIRLRKTAVWLKEAGSIKVTVGVTDAVTEKPVSGGFVSVEVLREGVWVSTTFGRYATGGRMKEALLVPRGERYRIRVAGPLEADPPYAPTTVERAAEHEELHVELILKRDLGD